MIELSLNPHNRCTPKTSFLKNTSEGFASIDEFDFRSSLEDID